MAISPEELHVTGKSQIAEQALFLIQKLYAIEAEIRKNTDSTAEQRLSTGNSIVTLLCSNSMNG